MTDVSEHNASRQRAAYVLGGWGCMGLEVPTFNLLILKALCLFKQDSFLFCPILRPAIKHFSP